MQIHLFFPTTLSESEWDELRAHENNRSITELCPSLEYNTYVANNSDGEEFLLYLTRAHKCARQVGAGVPTV